MGMREADDRCTTRPWASRWAGVCLLWSLTPGCSCGAMDGEEGEVGYVRCAQAPAPEDATWSVGPLTLTLADRVLTITGLQTYRVAAFEGPIGAPLGRAEMALLEAAKPDVVFYLGGLGDTEGDARASLESVSGLGRPVIFIPGGADRWPVVEAAFDGASETERAQVVLGAGVRRIDLADRQYALMPGAPLGRYAVDDSACGFGPSDVEVVQEVFVEPVPLGVTRHLLAWAAPSGWGLTAGLGRLEIGSLDLHLLAEALSATGGLFAHPRGEGTGVRVEDEGRQRWIVPRIGVEGSVSADGAYARAGVASLVLGNHGPQPAAGR